MGRVRITRPFVLLALAALLAPCVEASRTSVWESNPHAAVLARTDAAGLLAQLAPAGLLASLAPADDVDAVAVELPRFDLGDVVLVESELEREDRFGLGPLDLLGPTPLRGPPSSYPETRVRGLELLPPFRVGASPALSLWSRQACGSISCALASDGPEDPWGLAVSAARGGIVISDERSAQGGTFSVTYDWAQANPDAFYGLLTDVGGMGRSEADAFIGDHQIGLTGGARRQQLARMVSKDADDLIQEVKREWASQAKWGAAGYGAGKLLAGAYRGARGVLQFGDELGEAAGRGLNEGAGEATERLGRLELPNAERAATWVDEGGRLRTGKSAGMKDGPYEYQSSASGARSNPVSSRSQAPQLSVVDAQGKVITAKFDAAESFYLIDRKTAIHTGSGTRELARRQARVLSEHGLFGIWEVPSASQARRAIKLLAEEGADQRIIVRTVPR